MHKNDLIRLKHMLDAANEALLFARNKSRNDLDQNRQLTLSILKLVEIIGEASSKISKECRAQCSKIPWADIVAMRNRLIHGYFDIDLDRVWDTLTDDLPILAKSLQEIIDSETE